MIVPIAFKNILLMVFLVLAIGLLIHLATRIPKHIALHLVEYGLADPGKLGLNIRTNCYHSFGGAAHYLRLDGTTKQIAAYIDQSSGFNLMQCEQFDEENVLIEGNKSYQARAEAFNARYIQARPFIFPERPSWFDVELLTGGSKCGRTILYSGRQNDSSCTMIRRTGQSTLYIVIQES